MDKMPDNPLPLTPQEIEDRVAAGVKRGVREVAHDSDLMDLAAERFYERLQSHAADSAAKWIGRRILVSVATVMFVVSLTYLVKTGSLK